VADSIVTGDSGHSSLRLDALYYTSMGRTRDPRSFRDQSAWDAFRYGGYVLQSARVRRSDCLKSGACERMSS
jgi:hypothetical protein